MYKVFIRDKHSVTYLGGCIASASDLKFSGKVHVVTANCGI